MQVEVFEIKRLGRFRSVAIRILLIIDESADYFHDEAIKFSLGNVKEI